MLRSGRFLVAVGMTSLLSASAPARQPNKPAPSYTVHIRDLNGATHIIRVRDSGNDAVLDVVNAHEGQLTDSRRLNLWIMRTDAKGKRRRLPIDWEAMVRRRDASTNYLLMPGDEFFLHARTAK